MGKINLSRRCFVQSMAASSLLGYISGCQSIPKSSVFLDLEAQSNGRLGIAALNMRTGEVLHHRGNERFAMCSTFKWVLAALVLYKTERHQESLDRRIIFSKNDLVYYSPVTKKNVGGEGMTVAELCAATLTTSDNTAANLLLNTLEGPQGFTQMLRMLGDQTTRIDRFEIALNENKPGDPRDTTTPLAMLTLMQRFLFGDLLRDHSKHLLRQWMIDNQTGLTRLRAGLPTDWVVGDRTGTSEFNANNNLAFAYANQKPVEQAQPLLIVSFTNTPNSLTKQANAVHAQIAHLVFSELRVDQ